MRTKRRRATGLFGCIVSAASLSKPLPWGGGGLLGALLVGLFLSCSSIECPVQNTVSTHYAVCEAGGGSATLSDSLWVWTRRRDGTDTLLNSLVGKSDFYLQISYTHPEDTLIFFKGSLYKEWTLDTLWLKKDDIPHFESVDCSAHFFHRITAVRSTHEGIDSVTIANPNVDYDPSKIHLNIYFK